jgi:ATP-binding cassette subfamily C protein
MSDTRLFQPPEPMFSALRACRRHLLFAAGFSALVNLLYLTPTLYMMQVYDRVLPTGGVMTLMWMSILALFAYVVLGILSDVRVRVMVRAGLRLERLLAPAVIDAALGDGGAGRVRPQLMRDFDSLRQAITGPGMVAALDAPWTPIYILTAFLLHPAIGILTTLSSVLIVVLAWLNERATKATLIQSAEKMVQAHSLQESIVRRADVARALGMRGPLGRLLLLNRTGGINLQAEARFQGGVYSSLKRAVRLIQKTAVLGLGIWLAVDRQITSGAIIAASLLMGRALQPIDQIVGAWNNIVQGRNAYRNLSTMFAQQGQAPARLQLPAPTGNLQVENLKVELSPERVIIPDLSFAVRAGEFLGVIGPSGSGKTTLLKAIAGARPFQGGHVRLDGASVTDWDPEKLAAYIGYLPQDSALFAGSIRDNISRFARFSGVDVAEVDEKVIAAAMLTGVHEMILRLPQGYDTVLEPGGQGLSAGQTQRVALARVAYGDPVLVILDEPNAHLDGEGEMALMQTATALKDRGAAIIVAAHRTGVLGLADRLMILRAGQIEAIGPTNEIAARLKPGPQPVKAAGRSV